jgi:Na+-translocating ferredoxin:NAD+ oxidoreductase RnfG subunit
MRRQDIIALGVGTLIPIAIVAHAEVYFSPDQAAQMIFPAIKLERKDIPLTKDQVSAISKASGESVRNKSLVAFIGTNKETVFIDQVLGKHEFITIAVGIKPGGTVAGVEILEYRETYGSQVRNPEWRKQFLGKDFHSQFKLDSDIRNISGATLSSAHVTAGVKRLVYTYEILRTTL